MDKIRFLLIAAYLSASPHTADARILASERIQLPKACPSGQQLAVLTGREIPALLGTPIRRIALLRYTATGLSPVSFQIDQKDPQGRYLIGGSRPVRADSRPAVMDENDELVFRVKDIGKRLPAASLLPQDSLVEIHITEPDSATAGWIYAGISSHKQTTSRTQSIRYVPTTDSVRSEVYRIGFSERLPFLIDSFRWRLDAEQTWSANIIDTMKVRHKGTFLGFIPFQRSHDDYSSRLVSVSEGPLRVIRRTSNRIHMLWRLKTPAIEVDYVLMPDGFIMDAIIDIPFDIGAFFSNLESLTTIDWNDEPKLPKLTIHSPNGVTKLPVNGRMSADERAFNATDSNHFSVSSSMGEIFVSLNIPQDSPIQQWLYLRDDIEVQDAPENRQGQFGNVGFRTTGWEHVDTATHHLIFRVCINTP